MAATNYVDRKGELAREYGFQNSYKYGDPYLDSLLEKSDDKLEGYDKAMLNVNPDLKAKRDAYQKSLAKSNQLQTDLTNIESAKQFLQNNVSQQKQRINKLYDLQDKAAAISASIQGTNRVAGGLGAASNVLNNGRGVTEAVKHQQILQNDAQRESALANVAQQEANIPSVLASLEQAKANNELARAQANYYNASAKNVGKSYGGSYTKPGKGDDSDKETEDYEVVDSISIDGKTIKGTFIKLPDGTIYDSDYDLIYNGITKTWTEKGSSLLPDDLGDKDDLPVGKKITDDMNPALYNLKLKKI